MFDDLLLSENALNEWTPTAPQWGDAHCVGGEGFPILLESSIILYTSAVSEEAKWPAMSTISLQNGA